MAEYLTPGVYIEEVDTGNKPIEGVSPAPSAFSASPSAVPEPRH